MNCMDDLQELITDGFCDWDLFETVNVKKNGDLLLFSYNSRAIYKAEWTWLERVSRGLIVNSKTGEVVARPFDKFFGWLEGGRRSRGYIVFATEKVDGSLGILYRDGGRYKVSTRRQFDCKQALWATSFLDERFDLSGLPHELTLMFEIVYPDNRVIVDYGDREDLVLTGARNRFTGEYLPFLPTNNNTASLYILSCIYGFSLPAPYAFNNVGDIIEATSELEEDEEGYVVEFSDGQRFKFKGDRYVELHRLVNSISFKNAVRYFLGEFDTDLMDIVPESYKDEWEDLCDLVYTKRLEYEVMIQDAFSNLPKGSRKEFALAIKDQYSDLAQFLFARLDGYDLDRMILKKVYDDYKQQDST